MHLSEKIDPIKFQQWLWPHVTFYREQRDIIYSVAENDDTVVVAGHQLGKDFVTGFICLWFFLTRHPVRIVTTSVKDDHLRILWGEIGRFIDTAAHPLDVKDGGPLEIRHRDIRKVVNGNLCKISYLIGTVAANPEAMAGHHAEHALFICDEASSAQDEIITRTESWRKKSLLIGNPYECRNQFRAAYDDGDILHRSGKRYLRKVLRIKGEDSPPVRLAIAEIRAGLREPDPLFIFSPEKSWALYTQAEYEDLRRLWEKNGRPEPEEKKILPGVLSWDEYCKRRLLWDPIRQAIGLDAQFYDGAELLLYPPDWLDRAERVAAKLRERKRVAEGIGVDVGEGVAETSMAAVDRQGVIEMRSRKTGDTSVICGEVLAFARKHQCPADRVVIDAGGGGRQHVDRLRQQGFKVRAVGFGESATPLTAAARILGKGSDARLSFVNRRAEMYGILRELLDPGLNPEGFGIPAEYMELRRQLAMIPLLFDDAGRLRLPAKHKKGVRANEKTLSEILGCSPDQADALVLAVYVMQAGSLRRRAGGIR